MTVAAATVQATPAASPDATSAPKASTGAPALTFRIPIDELTRYAGATALITAVLAVAGVVATTAYLSAWGVPGPVIRLDPMTAALRSETVIYQFILLGVIMFGLAALRRRLTTHSWIAPHTRVAEGVVLAAMALLAGLSALLAIGHAMGPATTIIGGILLLVGHERRRLGARGLAVLFAVVAIYGAFETGFDSGVLVRDDPHWQTPISMTTRVRAAGLEGATKDGDAWRYEGLYLVFRDGDAVYVSRSGAGSRVWIVPDTNLMALEIGAR